MREHLRALTWVNSARLFLECALGGWILAVAVRWTAQGWPSLHPRGKPLPGDREAFFLLGAALILLGLARAVLVVSTLKRYRFARYLGLALSALDILTPLTLLLGFWGLIVYSRAETRVYFEEGPYGGARPDSPRSCDPAALSRQ